MRKRRTAWGAEAFACLALVLVGTPIAARAQHTDAPSAPPAEVPVEPPVGPPVGPIPSPLEPPAQLDEQSPPAQIDADAPPPAVSPSQARAVDGEHAPTLRTAQLHSVPTPMRRAGYWMLASAGLTAPLAAVAFGVGAAAETELLRRQHPRPEVDELMQRRGFSGAFGWSAAALALAGVVGGGALAFFGGDELVEAPQEPK